MTPKLLRGHGLPTSTLRTVVPLFLLVFVVAPVKGQNPPMLKQLTDAQAEFAFQLNATIRGGRSTNLFFSPYSVASALGMTLAGAQGETATEIAKALHVSALGQEVHSLLGSLNAELAKRETERPDYREGGSTFRLRIANDLWGQRGSSIVPAFQDLLRRDYRAKLTLLDFQTDAEGARKSINAAIAKQTEGRIQDLLEPANVRPDTALILTNAIYFKASWEKEFARSQTRDGMFTRSDESTVNVPFMTKSSELHYFATPLYVAMELPYLGDNVAFLAVLPRRGKFDEVDRILDAKELSSIVSGFTRELVHLKMPRFTVRSRYALERGLEALGIRAAFSATDADFSGINGARNFFIGGVVHEAFVKVDEEGTEAAAATAMALRAGEVRREKEPIVLTLDRPFLFVIRDRVTNALLFMGRVSDPSIAAK